MTSSLDLTAQPGATPLEVDAVEHLMWRLERRWTNHGQNTPDTSTWHCYEPLPLLQFLPGLRVVLEHVRDKSFLDLGCGIGSKLAIVHSLGLGFKVAGLDIHKQYIEAARELVPEATLTHGSILDVESFDAGVVYMYRPGVADDQQERLEAHVVDRLSPGQVLWLPCRGRARVPFKRVSSEIWVA